MDGTQVPLYGSTDPLYLSLAVVRQFPKESTPHQDQDRERTAVTGRSLVDEGLARPPTSRWRRGNCGRFGGARCSYAATVPIAATWTAAGSVNCTASLFGVGSSLGNCVLDVQQISHRECSIRSLTHYPACSMLAEDNDFGPATKGQVEVFQGLRGRRPRRNRGATTTWVWPCDAAKSGTRNTNAWTRQEYAAGHNAGCD